MLRADPQGSREPQTGPGAEARPGWQWVRVLEPHFSLPCPPQRQAICGGRTRSYLSELAPSGWPGGEPGNARVAAKLKSLCPGLPFPKRGVWEG